MINHKGLISIVLFMTLISLHLFSLVPLVNATNTVTLNSIAYECISNIGGGEEDYLFVWYGYLTPGCKWISYVAFNLSEIPIGAEIDTVKLKLRTNIVLKSTWVSVFNTSDTDWVKIGFSWDNRPDLDKGLATQWVSLHEEWYIWEHSYLTSAVKSALSKGIIGLALQSYFLTDVSGAVFFYRDAKLEITYTPDTSPPTLSKIEIKPSSPTPTDGVTVSATVIDDKSGVKEVYLYYSTDGGANWIKGSMPSIEKSIYKATIPQQRKDVTVQYYIEAFDKALNRAKSNTFSYTVRLPLIEEMPWLVAILFGIPIIIGILIFRYVRRKLHKSQSQ